MKQNHLSSEAVNLRIVYGEKLSAPITIWSVLNSVSRSGWTRDITLYVISDNRPVYIGRETKKGCGMDMGFGYAYDVFCEAYPEYRYQDFLVHSWL